LGSVGDRREGDGKGLRGFFLFGSEDEFFRVLGVKFGFAFFGADESFAFEVIVGKTAFGGGLEEGGGFFVEVGMNLHKNSC
jgi:hypothetical protein